MRFVIFELSFRLKWFDDWTKVSEQFDANALFGRFVMREELSSRFACRISRKLHCTRCHHDEIISENIPYKKLEFDS